MLKYRRAFSKETKTMMPLRSPANKSNPDLGNVEVINALRGVAALAVMWFHFTRPSALIPSETSSFYSILTWSGAWGWMGVEMFFAISGFILPYSMYRARYQIRNLFTFLCKRITRLDPPYFASIVLALALWWLASHLPFHKGPAFELEYPRLFAHVGYLNDILGYPWHNVVFWTLAIEFQFYLLIAVLFPLVIHSSKITRFSITPTLAAISLVFPFSNTVLAFLAFFALGMLTFQFYLRQIPSWFFWSAFPLIGFITATQKTVASACLASATCLAIIFIKQYHVQILGYPMRTLTWMGTISYSLYLVHTIIGGKIVNIGGRLPQSPWNATLIIVTACGASIFSAWIFYLLIEGPSKLWASSIRYKKKENDSSIEMDKSTQRESGPHQKNQVLGRAA
jgi:peptidoglycan/LPS O-acetylase OafA/YrhL